ncbi:acyltransferase family protein [Allomesorhizobium camelthorni]|uniref:Acyltransferase n=1 Tax=Allomesorhizobium camelthorni TaxID=475069 RepID=A0A6G4WJ33_9HYPH|nr:acyltransferase family protein [Mesorhizobium camelthorni]NGO54236.1 acyltransferase [Mesorhizobium camelthorni]
MNRFDYRPDIDGLRAFAVSAVVLFHAGFSTLSGGYVGVDVFFVISGYLITKLIVEQVRAGTFSFSDFYARRARRLFPALFSTIFVTFVCAAFIQGPEDFRGFSGSSAMAILSLSNIYFWMQSGYFDAAATTKPLLHTWSLGVEEQFYLIWPAIISALMRKGRLALLAVAVLGLISFTACLLAMRFDLTAAFFLTPFRIFEFACGAALVWAKTPRRLSSDIAYTTGGLAVLYAVLQFDAGTSFPGWHAALPTLGAAMMIYGGRKAVAALPFKTAPAQLLGRASYSIYLVHWPIVVFWLHTTGRDLDTFQGVAAIALSILLGYLLHSFIERPLRYSHALQGQRLVTISALAAALIVAPSWQSWATKGWTWRLPKTLRRVNSYDIDVLTKYVWANHIRLSGNTFKPGRKHILIVGDSQSADFTNILLEGNHERNVDIVTYAFNYGCNTPYADNPQYWNQENIYTSSDPSLEQKCKERIDAFLSSPALKQADVVIVAFLWERFGARRMRAAADKIESISPSRVYVLGRKNLLKSSIDFVNMNGKLDGLGSLAAQYKPSETLSINKMLAKQFGNRYLDIFSSVCPDQYKCVVLDEKQNPLFYDAAHLTPSGARYFAKHAIRKLIELANL